MFLFCSPLRSFCDPSHREGMLRQIEKDLVGEGRDPARFTTPTRFKRQTKLFGSCLRAEEDDREASAFITHSVFAT